MINVAHFFNPKHAVRATQAFKARKWTQLEYTELLERAAALQRKSRPPHLRAPARSSPSGQEGVPATPETTQSIPSDALKALVNFLPRVTNPVLRQVCLDQLDSLGNIESRHPCCASFLATECYEEACSYIDPMSESCADLVAFGGAEQVLRAVGDSPMKSTLWSRLFDACVHEENYDAAKQLWLRPDRPSFKAASEPTLLRFVELIGRYRDRAMLQRFLRTSSESGELPLLSGPVAACLNCLTSDPHFWKIIADNEQLLEHTLTIQDGRYVSDALAGQAVPILQHFRAQSLEMPLVLGNLLLQGLYRKYTSRLVLHVYRHLVDEARFVPNSDTAQLLANSAYRLGNSKLLSYEIYRQMTALGVSLSRKFHETILMCQLVGTGYSGALFFVAEMFRRRVPLRSHVQRLLFNRFERVDSSAPLLRLFQQRRPERLYPEFDRNQAEAESELLGLEQARANAETFLHGHNAGEDALGELQNMLVFESKRSARP